VKPAWHRAPSAMVTTYHNRPSRSNSSATNNRPPSILNRFISLLPSELAAQMQSLLNRPLYNLIPTQKLPRSLQQAQRDWNWSPRRLFNLPHLFIAIWVLVLLWGERWVFQKSVEECRWENWERWVSSSRRVGRVWMDRWLILEFG